jgi:rsbT co-antagonist protein RsbR
MPSSLPSGSAAQLARRLRILKLMVQIDAGFNALIFCLLWLGSSRINPLLIGVMIGLLVLNGVTWLLAHLKYVEPGVHIFFATLIIATFLSSLSNGVQNPALPTLFLPIVGATLLLRPRWSFIYAGFALLTVILIMLFVPTATSATSSRLSQFILVAVLYCAFFMITALLSYLAARGLEDSLAESERRGMALERANRDQERRIDLRTSDLQQALATISEREQALQQTIAQLEDSNSTIREMSVPVIPLARGVIVMPLIGAIDSARADLFLGQLLKSVEQERARTVMIDITGVPIIDTQVAGILIKAAQAVRLLGATVCLVGVRPEVAQAIIGLGIDLSMIRTQRDLQSGLAGIDLGARVAA